MSPTETIKVVVVEDNPDVLSLLTIYLDEIPGFLMAGGFLSAEDALKAVGDLLPDILLLDIELPGMDGFTLLEEIRLLGQNPAVIFITAFDSYALKAIKHAAFDYLLKPLSKKDLQISLDNCRNVAQQASMEKRLKILLQQLNSCRKVKFNTRHGFVMIDPDDIIYCEADWNYTRIIMGYEKSMVVTLNLGKVLEMIQSGKFCRLSRSYCINLSFLAEVDRKKRVVVLVKDCERFEISTSRKSIHELEVVVETGGAGDPSGV